MRKVNFTVEGTPVPKGRPRFARIVQNRVKTYTPYKTTAFETLVSWRFKEAFSGEPFKGVVEIEVFAYFGKLENRKTKVGIRPCMKRIDVDNLLKAVADGLNGVAYLYDSQIWKATVQKEYTDLLPRTVVVLWFGERF